MPAPVREQRSTPATMALVVGDTPEFLEELERGLTQLDFKVVTAEPETVDFAPLLKKFQPELVIVSLTDPDPDALANLRTLSESLRYTLLWYGDASEPSAESAEALGAHGILFHPSDLDQFATVLQLAGAQAGLQRELRAELAKLQDDLETRKFVDRARGILMQQQGLTEDEAYHSLRRESRRQRKPMKEVAQAVILAQGLIGGAGKSGEAAGRPGAATAFDDDAPARASDDEERDDVG